MRSATALLFVAIAVSGCSEYSVKQDPDGVVGPAPDIVVNPAALLYGTLTSGDDEVQTFEVSNVGEATLNVTNVVIGSGIAYTVLGPLTQFDLEPGEATTVDIQFTPLGADENYGQVLVLSDDPDTPEATVDLLGYGSVPELKIEPWSHVFTNGAIPCGDLIDLTLSNVGNENLVISDFAYTSTGIMTLDAGALRSELAPTLTLLPGEFRVVTVHFNPTEVGADTGVLEVTSNDPRGVLTADQNGEGAYADTNSEAFTEPGVPPVDVMMLIDHSCSMEGANTDDVEDGMPSFVNELQQVADWQLLQITRESGCSNGGIIYPTTPNAAQLLIDNAWNEEIGFGDARTEALLEHAARALSLTGPGQCNEGFLRPGALLHIIVLSDEPERSGQPYTTWLDQFYTYVAAPDFVKVSAVVDLNNSCGEGAAQYTSAADATGGAKLNICNADWGTEFGTIASEVLAGIRTYNLAEPAVEGTIVVIVNGTPTTDFDYSGAGNSVTINSPAVGSGDLVEISYAVADEC